MTIGMIGLGKLGLPAAYAIASRGHEVIGYDVNPQVKQYIKDGKTPYTEAGLPQLMADYKVKFHSVEYIIDKSDIIFLAVQTPHERQYEGDTRLPDTRKDFNYNYLIAAVEDIAKLARQTKRPINLAVISTCLPGTYRRDIAPLLNDYVNYIYNPWFIAMGTVIADVLNPEFILLGGQRNWDIEGFYFSLHDKPLLWTDITTAEAVKVSYNTFITMKTVLANAWGEMAHKLGFNIDDVYKAWSLSTDRLISPKYLKSGVGDGGGCHPRDNIALSYIAQQVGMSHNIWEDLMSARQDHMAWLAQYAIDLAENKAKQLIVLGRSFKPETNIETGSPAILMVNIIRESYPVISVEDLDELPPAVYVLATAHQKYKDYKYPKGSIVLDPFGLIDDRPGVEVIRVGRP